MKKILIIDDDPDIILAARMCLENAGYHLIEAHSGPEGLEAIKQHTPELIILDVMMESQTEGFQTALQLRSPNPQSEFAPYKGIPIIMLTAIHTTTPLRFEPDEDFLPVDAFIDKPLNPDALLETIDALLNSDQQER